MAGICQATLRSQPINVSTLDTSAARLDFPLRNVDNPRRASVHDENKTDDIDALAEAIASI